MFMKPSWRQVEIWKSCWKWDNIERKDDQWNHGIVVKDIIFGEGLQESKKDDHIEMRAFHLHLLREYKPLKRVIVAMKLKEDCSLEKKLWPT